jgi:SulP family sulfate permease
VLIKGVREGHIELFTTVGVLSSLRHSNHLFDDLAPAIAHARSHIERDIAGSGAQG